VTTPWDLATCLLWFCTWLVWAYAALACCTVHMNECAKPFPHLTTVCTLLQVNCFNAYAHLSYQSSQMYSWLVWVYAIRASYTCAFNLPPKCSRDPKVVYVCCIKALGLRSYCICQNIELKFGVICPMFHVHSFKYNNNENICDMYTPSCVLHRYQDKVGM
jgi:hypothetical protein